MIPLKSHRGVVDTTRILSELFLVRLTLSLSNITLNISNRQRESIKEANISITIADLSSNTLRMLGAFKNVNR